ncbi:unnamed protein product [Alopecurus aequalis]
MTGASPSRPCPQLVGSGQRGGEIPLSPTSVLSTRPMELERPVVSGLGLSSESSSQEASGAAQAITSAATSACAPSGQRIKDRLTWIPKAPSHKSLWRKRKAAHRAAEAAAAESAAAALAAVSSPRSLVPPELHGLCFNCYYPGHMKRDCKNAMVCLRCGDDGHGAKGCPQPRSPRSEEDLRRELLAKRALMAPSSAPPRLGLGGQHRGAVAVETARRPLSPPRFLTAPVVDMSRHVEPSMVAEGADAPLYIVRRSPIMADLESRLRFAMVACVGGPRPEVSPE